MEPTGERFLPQMKGVIHYEHLIRYFFVINQLDLSGKTVVDLASGEGYGSNILSQFAEFVYGFDISHQAIDHAKKLYRRSNLNFATADVSNIPLKDNTVDIFVSFETIEHHDKHQQMMAEIKRVLKPEGILVISSPDKKYYTDLPGYFNPYHINELYYSDFKLLIQKYFKYSFFYFQNNFSGSIITPDFFAPDNKTININHATGFAENIVPLYNMAIATSDCNYIPKNRNLLYGHYNVITDEDVFQAQQEIRRTAEYKLGKKILKYFGFLRNYLEKKQIEKS